MLDPEPSPALRGFDLLVEIHDGPDSTRLRDLLSSRFEPTHTIETIPFEGRDEGDAGVLNWIKTNQFRLAAVDEKRQLGLEWLLIKRNA